MIGQSIEYHCELCGMTKYRLADWLCVTQPAVSKLVSKKANPTYKTLKRVAKVLGVKVSDIILKAEQLEQSATNTQNK